MIREIKQQNPALQIVVTYSSPSAKKMLKSIDGIDAWGPIPWDTSTNLMSFIHRFKPNALLVARTDLWPMQAHLCQKMKIPAFLFSATFAQNSSRLTGITKHLTAYALNQLNGIYVVNEDDKKNLSTIKLKVPITVNGDTRYDQVFHRLQHPKPLKESLKPQAPIFVLGSTWPEDEEVLLPLLPDLLRCSWQIIIAPHETTETHLRTLKNQLEELDIGFDLYSSCDVRKHAVLIVDKVGILADLYQWGDLAFVGGSFKKQVHSVMEPLAAGLPVLIGPHHLNNRESLIMQEVALDKGLYAVTPTAAKNSEEVYKHWQSIFEIMRKDEARNRLKEKLQQHMKQQTGNSAALVRELLQKLH